MKNTRLGCLSPFAIIFSFATVLAVLAAAFLDGGRMFTAGALNDNQGNTVGGVQSHAEIGNDCTRCHPAPWDATTMDELCQRCHKDLPDQLKDPVSLHGALLTSNPVTCRTCHPEHRGEHATLTSMTVKKFPHEVMGFMLESHVQRGDGRPIGCADCHIDDVTTFSPDNCADCHQFLDSAFTSKHVETYGEGCLGCHDGMETISKKFDHSQTLFQLVGKHGEASCEQCHAEARQVADFKSMPSECGSCHGEKDVHNGQFGQACDQCHKVETWTAGSFDHNTTKFKLTGKHEGPKCADCHNKTAPEKANSVCSSCHLKDDAHAGALGLACDDCHTSQGWKPANFDHNLSIFKLTGKHETATCEKCHINNVLKGTPTNCFACHQKDDHHNGTFGQDCGICHATTGWTPAAFDHNLSIFKLTGQHESVACEQCHVNNVFKGTPSDCIGCHQADDTHNGSLGTQCYNCHSTQAWKPAYFDHNLALFKLTGAHIYVLCQSCHFNDVFKGTPSTCYGCHVNDDPHKGTLGQQCESCHGTQAWKPANFDHNRSVFKLTGAHSNTLCQRCHLNNVFKGTPMNCFACHRGDDHHNGAFGQYCETCHNTNAWKPAGFDHNLAAFKLTGAHSSAACSRCHVNGVFKGTPMNCFACHQSDDKHKGSMGPNCESCHNTSTWAGASFDHNLAAFKLNGAHSSVTCTKCHINGVFKGTPMNCFACHANDDFHKGTLGKSCESCHTTSAWKPSSFNHNVSIFKLTGAHTSAACAKCHINAVFKGTPTNCYACHAADDKHKGSMGQSCGTCHSTSTWSGASFNHNLASFKLTGAHVNTLCTKCHINGVFNGTPATCYACHQADDKHKGGMGQGCGSCHSTSTWAGAVFDHNKASFKLTGAHVNALCSKCHINNVYKGTPATCYACHQADDKHKGGMGQGCASCHSTSTWAGAVFDHNKASFKLTGAHVNALCSKCHINNVYKGTPATCYACHQADDKHKGGMGQGCGTCHTTSTWAGAVFDHNSTLFKLTGAHITALCANCHVNNVFKGTPTNCYACHQADDKHKGGMGQSCGTCHTTSTWAGAVFDHNTTLFKLTGAHITALCANCHINNVFKGTPTNCYACHQADDKHKGGMGQSCGTCHTTNTWAGAVFDHNSTLFKLTGAHIKALCANCHVNNVYKGTPTSCYACHQADDKHKGAMGQGCGSCHTTSTWTGAVFDHNTTQFKLTGAHISALCVTCHVNNVYKGTPTTCYACHQADDKHKGAMGQVCSNCHSTTTWAGANFDHNLSIFKLTGAHVNTLCGKCHINNVYKGTATTCIGCHSARDVHKGAMGTNCASCHTTSTWTGAKYDHNLAAFKLTGAHVSVTCKTCHINYVYKGTVSTCIGCHAARDVHKGAMGTNCASCHTTSTWSGAKYDHNLAAFKLTGAHMSVACKTCHVNYVYKGTASTCIGCHAARDIHKGAMGTNCATCHSTTTWAGAVFDHNLAAFKLTGAHLSVTCAKCHINNVYKGTSQACSGCHAEPAYHAGLFAGTSCSACHTTKAWRPATYSLAHRFPMNHGNTVNSPCATCHPATLKQWTCYNCHNQAEITKKHQEENIADFSNCMRCHPTGRNQ